NDASLIRFGREGARIALHGDRAGSPVELNVILQVGAAKRASLNGARLQTAEQLRGEVATLVFTPDRLVVVKGGPAARRAYFDRALGRGTPTQAALPAEYGAAPPAPGRTSTTSRFWPAAASSVPSVRRASSDSRCWRCCSPRRSLFGTATACHRCCSSTTSSPSSTRSGAGSWPNALITLGD